MLRPWPTLAAERPVVDDLRLSPVVTDRRFLPGVEQHTTILCRTATSYVVRVVFNSRPIPAETSGLRSLN